MYEDIIYVNEKRIEYLIVYLWGKCVVILILL